MYSYIFIWIHIYIMWFHTYSHIFIYVLCDRHPPLFCNVHTFIIHNWTLLLLNCRHAPLLCMYVYMCLHICMHSHTHACVCWHGVRSTDSPVAPSCQHPLSHTHSLYLCLYVHVHTCVYMWWCIRVSQVKPGGFRIRTWPTSEQKTNSQNQLIKKEIISPMETEFFQSVAVTYSIGVLNVYPTCTYFGLTRGACESGPNKQKED